MTTLSDLYRHSVDTYGRLRVNWTYGTDRGYSYESFGKRCEELSRFLSSRGVGAGDRVAIYSTGNPNWSLAFFAAVAFGRVAVPILPDFSGNEAEHVLDHSGSKVLFASEKQLSKLSDEALSRVQLVYSIEDLSLVRDNSKDVQPVQTCWPAENDTATIIYTSGTTGAAKGVELTHRNFMANIEAAYDLYPIGVHDVLLSVLPLAHTYELSLGMLYPFSAGSSVCYIDRAPTPSLLMKVMKDVRPSAMLAVPLIIEKVYKGTILPMIKKSPLLTWMDKHMNLLLCRLIGRRMISTFGGRMRFFGIGGAKLDVDVERFLHRARFPYYIGYGLTECAPLLAVSCYRTTIPGQIGREVKGVRLRLEDINPETGEGELVAKGENIFPGYYRDPERTAKAFTQDGWFRTGDIASVDAQGRYAIKGRIGNMIVGASGENIYPEEIEKVVKEIPNIEDVIIVSRGKFLVCLVKAADSLFDMSSATSDEQTRKAIDKFKGSVMEYVNGRVNVASHIASVELMTEPFEKTATLKIRRFLYANDAPTV